VGFFVFGMMGRFGYGEAFFKIFKYFIYFILTMVLIELFGPIGLALSFFSIRKFGPIIKHSMKNRKKRKRLYE
tara:strand:- start:62 stop:280 length:219 start_codon:yes stop_codon:yes gene_type:complete